MYRRCFGGGGLGSGSRGHGLSSPSQDIHAAGRRSTSMSRALAYPVELLPHTAPIMILGHFLYPRFGRGETITLISAYSGARLWAARTAVPLAVLQTAAAGYRSSARPGRVRKPRSIPGLRLGVVAPGLPARGMGHERLGCAGTSEHTVTKGRVRWAKRGGGVQRISESG